MLTQEQASSLGEDVRREAFCAAMPRARTAESGTCLLRRCKYRLHSSILSMSI